MVAGKRGARPAAQPPGICSPDKSLRLPVLVLLQAGSSQALRPSSTTSLDPLMFLP